jgi:hypothetical protein
MPVFGQGQVMGQQFQAGFYPWRSGNGCDLWLSLLVDAMEEVSRPEIRALPCDISLLTAVGAQLARPASSRVGYASDFSWRN